MIFFARIGTSLIQAAIITAMWAGFDWLFSPANPWHYSEAFFALFTGAMVAGPWTKRDALKCARRTISTSNGTITSGKLGT